MPARRFMGPAFPLLLLSMATAIPAGATDEPAAEEGPHPVVSRRPLMADDLVRLRDIGPLWPEGGRPIFVLSPDSRKIAFQVRQADPVANRYDLSMSVMDVVPGATPVTVDKGGDAIFSIVTGTGGVRLETGLAATVPIVWSRDGTHLFFLKRTGGRTRIWQAAADGSESKALFADSGNVTDLALSSDGHRLVYSADQPDQSKQDALNREAAQGYRFDARWIPIFANRPEGHLSTQRIVASVEIAAGEPGAASSTDIEALAAKQSALPAALTLDGRIAYVSRPERGSGPRTELHADDSTGHSVQCVAASCSGATALWWTADGHSVRYVRRDGWADSQTAFYEWRPGSTAPRRLFGSDDMLVDCRPMGTRVLCGREQAATPRQLVLIDPVSGTSQILFDPNPQFGQLALGKVERLHWRNRFGIESFGDLVYPVSYVPGRSYPLVIVQYVSRGFLRGGTGDEFPIQAFANRGFAVLSLQRPATDKLAPGRTGANRERHLLAGFKDRFSVQSSIEIAVRQLIGRGIVDAGRIGITGLSDGSTTVQFAAVNSRLFKAASVSGCCWEPFQDALLGPIGASAYHAIGWPPLTSEAPGFWSRISLVKNARRVALPLLMQQSDDEYLGALASYTALKQAGKPVALYVFPNEHHVKWQPAHRLAAYERNLAWFDYWLRGVGDVSDILGGEAPPGVVGGKLASGKTPG